MPDPSFPFLGVHLTRGIDGSVHAGPERRAGAGPRGLRLAHGQRCATSPTRSRYPGFWRLARRHWRTGVGEMRAVAVRARRFADSLRRLVPDVRDDDLVPAPAGVRAQAVRPRRRAGRRLPDRAARLGGARAQRAVAGRDSALEIARHIVGLLDESA